MKESTSKKAVIFGLIWLVTTIVLSVIFDIK